MVVENGLNGWHELLANMMLISGIIMQEQKHIEEKVTKRWSVLTIDVKQVN